MYSGWEFQTDMASCPRISKTTRCRKGRCNNQLDDWFDSAAFNSLSAEAYNWQTHANSSSCRGISRLLKSCVASSRLFQNRQLWNRVSRLLSNKDVCMIPGFLLFVLTEKKTTLRTRWVPRVSGVKLLQDPGKMRSSQSSSPPILLALSENRQSILSLV